jgi:hypothetical protein
LTQVKLAGGGGRDAQASILLSRLCTEALWKHFIEFNWAPQVEAGGRDPQCDPGFVDLKKRVQFDDRQSADVVFSD